MRTIVLLTICMLLLSCNKQKSFSDKPFGDELDSNDKSLGKLTPELLWKFGRVGEAALSPDGKQLVYTIRRYYIKANKGNTEIFIKYDLNAEPVNISNSEVSENTIKWRRDGKAIGYLAPKGEVMAIWEMSPDGSGKHTISPDSIDVTGFDYSPDGKHLFFTSRVKTDTCALDIYPDLDKASGMVINDLMYRHWDSWTDYKHSHIFIADLENGEIASYKDIMKDEPYDSPLGPYFDLAEISWSADGSKLAYTCKRLKGKEYAISTNSDIFLYDLQSGLVENLSDGNPGYDRLPVFSPDGKYVAWQSMATAGYESDKDRLMLYSFADKKKTDITANFDQSVANINWGENSDCIYFISGIKATFQVYKALLNDKSITQLTQGKHDYVSLCRKNGVMVGEKHSFSMASEIFKVDESGAETQLTYTNKDIYENIKMGQVLEKWVTTTDKQKMLVWLILPPNFDSTQKYPAILYCQGGPQSAVSQFFSYRWNLQLMAANGYVVIAPNRRGLPTFGKEWNDQIAGDYGGQNIKDYLSAVDEIKKEPFINADRIGAVGASYGGFSVFYLAGCHQKRFKAFIAHCGMFNLESQYAETEEVFFTNHDLGGPYWENPQPVSFKYSPHRYVQNWDTPILISTGGNDFRIPYTESLQAFNSAQLRGIPSKLLYFPDESHWILRPHNSILWQREFFKWLDKWLKR